MLDPLADRLMISGAAVVLAAVKGLLPTFLVALLVGRDALSLAWGYLLRGKVRVNSIGKAATAVKIFRPGVPAEILFYVGIGLSLVAGLLYARSAQNSIR